MSCEEHTSFWVANTAEKGRVCVSKRPFAIGETVLEDRAFVYASELPHRCLACCMEHESRSCPMLGPGGPLECPAELLAKLDVVADEMCDFDSVNTLDRARCFIKCLLMRLKNPRALDPILSLTAANLRRCSEGARAFRERVPGLFAPGLDDEAAAKVLGALNTNSHELEQVEGSGLFLVACILEHDCNPNCSFTTYGEDIWLTAIRPVAAGERLSIDYGNNFYLPTAQRREELQETYEFVCSCEACTSLPDLCRAFCCPLQGCKGKVCPRGDGGDADGVRPPDGWKCLACGYGCNEEEIEVFLEAEEVFAEELDSPDVNIEGVEDIDELVAEAKVIHPTHYAVFWAIEATAKSLSGRSTVDVGAGIAAKGAAAASAIAAERAWSRALQLIEEVLPGFHHEKVVFWDGLAQARTVVGDLQGAHEAFEKAYRASVMVSGATTRPTLEIKTLVDRQPTSVQELRARYNAGKM